MPPALLMRSAAIWTPTSAVLPMIAAAPDSGCIVPIRYALLWASANRSGTGDSIVAPKPMPLAARTRRRVGPLEPPWALAVQPFCLSAIRNLPWIRSVSLLGRHPGLAGAHQQESRRLGHIPIAQIAAARSVSVVIGLERGEAVMPHDVG